MEMMNYNCKYLLIWGGKITLIPTKREGIL